MFDEQMNIGCRLATQVALLGEVPEPFDSVKGLVKWQEAHRRRLQQSKQHDSTLLNRVVERTCSRYDLLQHGDFKHV